MFITRRNTIDLGVVALHLHRTVVEASHGARTPILSLALSLFDLMGCRILVAGPSGSRKTSLIHALLHGDGDGDGDIHGDDAGRISSQLPLPAVSLPALHCNGGTVYVVDGSSGSMTSCVYYRTAS